SWSGGPSPAYSFFHTAFAFSADFGLAKKRGSEYLKSAAGTIVYSCPEIVQNMGYGEKADVWSFGCCVYEMTELRPPFYSQNMLALATQIVEGKYAPIAPDRSK
ncbi:hypothetical protein COOONC_22709, partial [Cooperia oncophora]